MKNLGLQYRFIKLPKLKQSTTLVLNELLVGTKKDYVCYYSNEEIANNLNISLASVKRSISELKQLGIIKTSNTYNHNTLKKSREVRVCVNNIKFFDKGIKAVFISNDILLDEKLNTTDKILLSLFKTYKDTVYFTNSYLAKSLHIVSITSVDRSIKKLVQLNYIALENVNGRRKIKLIEPTENKIESVFSVNDLFNAYKNVLIRNGKLKESDIKAPNK